MILHKTENPLISYSFGTCTDNLSAIVSREASIFVGEKIVDISKLVMSEQTHSDKIHIISEHDQGHGFLFEQDDINLVDGFICTIPEIYIAIKTADCTPILCYSKVKNIVGGVHSGREGTKKGIIKKLITMMINEFQCTKEEIVVRIGPAISGYNYEVDEATFDDFVKTTNLLQEPRHIDMKKVILRDVLTCGILSENIFDESVCTFNSQNYNSYRRDKTKERQLSIIGIINDTVC